MYENLSRPGEPPLSGDICFSEGFDARHGIARLISATQLGGARYERLPDEEADSWHQARLG